MLSAARLVAAWTLDRREPPHRRLSRLVRAMDEEPACGGDTLGDRNRRLLRLHRALCSGPLEACVKCSACGADNEITVPVESILRSPSAPRDARVKLRCGRRLRVYRLPRMDDIEAASNDGDVRASVLERCRVDGPPGTPHAKDVLRLGRGFERLDPLANIVIDMDCSACGAALAASVEVAALVASEIDAIVDALYRDVDRLAAAYGWSEASILSLPSERRHRYVAMAAARAAPAFRGRA